MCLRAEWARVSRFRRADRVAFLNAKKSSLASTILEMLWRDEREWMPLLVYDRDSGNRLCYFGIAEDLEPFLTRWMNADVGSVEVGPEFVGWRGKLLDSMVAAHLMHATPSDGGATRTIEYFFNIVSPKKAAHKAQTAGRLEGSNLRSLSISKSIKTLSAELAFKGKQYSASDPGAYPRFYAFFERFSSSRFDPTAREFSLAGMRAFHPNPRGRALGPMLNFLRKRLDNAQSESDLDKFLDSLFVHPSRLMPTLQHLQRAFKHDGRPEDVAWVDVQFTRLAKRIDEQKQQKTFGDVAEVPLFRRCLMR